MHNRIVHAPQSLNLGESLSSTESFQINHIEVKIARMNNLLLNADIDR